MTFFYQKRWRRVCSVLQKRKLVTGANGRRANSPHFAAYKAYRVAPSKKDGAGRGVFAVRDLKKNSTIGSYVIATVKQTEAQFRDEHPSGRATHSAKIKNHYYTALGAGDRTHNQAGMLNTAPRGERNNARLLTSGRVVASRGVKKDGELLLAYGNSYKI